MFSNHPEVPENDQTRTRQELAQKKFNTEKKFIADYFAECLQQADPSNNFNIMDCYGEYLLDLNKIKKTNSEEEGKAIECIYTYLKDDKTASAAEKSGELSFESRVFYDDFSFSSKSYELEFPSNKNDRLPIINYKKIFSNMSTLDEFPALCKEIDDTIKTCLGQNMELNKLKQDVDRCGSLNDSNLRDKEAREKITQANTLFMETYKSEYNKCLDEILLEVLKRQAHADNWCKFLKVIEPTKIDVQGCQALMMSFGCFPLALQIKSYIMHENSKKEENTELKKSKSGIISSTINASVSAISASASNMFKKKNKEHNKEHNKEQENSSKNNVTSSPSKMNINSQM